MSGDQSACDCLNKVNTKLDETGHILASTMFGHPDRPTINILRRDTWKPETRRGKHGTMIPTFCPFCGLKYGGSVDPTAALAKAGPASDPPQVADGMEGRS